MRRVSWNQEPDGSCFAVAMSRLAWGVWVEILPFLRSLKGTRCHASHEACELKFKHIVLTLHAQLSRLAWGVWVEIGRIRFEGLKIASRLAWGVWVEIYHLIYQFSWCLRHASHEACELKCRDSQCMNNGTESRLAWGVWVEITVFWDVFYFFGSRLAWGVWVEIIYFRAVAHTARSRLAWGVWVEIIISSFYIPPIYQVTPRMRRVSWN